MNKLQKIKVKGQLKLIKDSTEDCAFFLNSLLEHLEIENPDIKANLLNVIKHQRNMIKFFGMLEQQL